MNPNEIKASIARAGTTQTAIAKHLDMSLQSVTRVVNLKMRSERIERELQKITGRPIYPTQSSKGRAKSTWNGLAA